ncbi:MAG: hypothetical protein QXK39_05525 [Nitrososphaerota archaeon]
MPGDYIKYHITTFGNATTEVEYSTISIISISSNGSVTLSSSATPWEESTTERIPDPISDWTIPSVRQGPGMLEMPTTSGILIKTDSKEGTINRTYIYYQNNKSFAVDVELNVKKSRYEWNNEIYEIANVTLIVSMPEVKLDGVGATKWGFIGYYENSTGILLYGIITIVLMQSGEKMSSGGLETKLVETNVCMIPFQP